MMRKIYNVRRLWPLLMYRSKYYHNCNVVDLNIQNFESLVPNFEHQRRFFFLHNFNHQVLDMATKKYYDLNSLTIL